MKTCFTLFPLLFPLMVSEGMAQHDLSGFVNPLVGTQRMGHTYPGATVPFGMVQLSPDTDTVPYAKEGKYNPEVYGYCSGYQYDDKTIVGFSHTHFSGTGHSDLGDFLIMPVVGDLQLNPGTREKVTDGYRSPFSHEKEIAEPGYYQVYLEKYDILAELTATTRVGFHQYTFPKSDQGHLVLDLMHGIYNYDGKNTWTYIRVENEYLITGYRQTTGWARTRTLYFAMLLDKPIESYGFRNFDEVVYKGFWRKFDQKENFPEMAGKNIRAYFNFKTGAGEKVRVKFALSPVSTEGALLNLESEIPSWDFEKVRQQARDHWNTELGKISSTFLSEKDQRTFYTALYHCFLSPTVYMDADKQYMGLDRNIHRAENNINYTTFSLWDTYRALHPLFNLIQPARNRDMVLSMLDHYSQSVHHMLPVWSHHASENWCMIGYHAVSVIADAIAKGVPGIPLDLALEACVSTSNYEKFDGIGSYRKLGYVAEDQSSSSVSKTLEYAYDDWAIAQVAKSAGKDDLVQEYLDRSRNFRHVFDPSTGFMRPRLKEGGWQQEFSTLSTHGQGFIEGNSWNYSFYVPHDIPGLITLMGGKKTFVRRLDSLFTMKLPDEFFKETEDITRDGIVGNYVHGNEPSHHVPYLYNWAGKAWKTQEKARMLLTTMYADTPDGLCGNDDCGQMSAWYVFSALGFYPVCPGSEVYAIGSPLVKSGSIQLENGKIFQIETVNQSVTNVYIQKIFLNDKPMQSLLLQHKDIAKGGKLVFYMGPKPVKKQNL